MRVNPLGHIALLVLALSALAQSAVASERFACADGTFIEVTSQNRAEQYQNPCVRAWFEAQAARRKKRDHKAGGTQPEGSKASGTGEGSLATDARSNVVPASADASRSQTGDDASSDARVRTVRAGQRR